jgi:hypothetical protein
VKNAAEPADVFAVFVAEPGKLKASRNIHVDLAREPNDTHDGLLSF